jgi:hypothetical protein
MLTVVNALVCALPRRARSRLCLRVSLAARSDAWLKRFDNKGRFGGPVDRSWTLISILRTPANRPGPNIGLAFSLDRIGMEAAACDCYRADRKMYHARRRLRIDGRLAARSQATTLVNELKDRSCARYFCCCGCCFVP